MTLRLGALPVLALLAVGVPGCDSARPGVAGMSAVINGEPWEARADALVNRSGQLVVSGGAGPEDASCGYVDPCEELVLIAEEPFDGPGSYRLAGSGEALFAYLDGDLILATYGPVGPPPEMTVEAHDPATGEVSGSFEVVFVRDVSAFQDDTFRPPDTLRVMSGRFTAGL